MKIGPNVDVIILFIAAPIVGGKLLYHRTNFHTDPARSALKMYPVSLIVVQIFLPYPQCEKEEFLLL